jgi:hypothetical protein
MTKMASMSKSAADRAAEKKAMGESAGGPLQNSQDREGPTVNLEHHHLKNMGVGGGLKSGDKVNLSAEGHVEESESRMHQGESRHSARIRIKKMGVEAKSPRGDEDERAGLKNEIERAHGEHERGKDEGAERKDASASRGGKKFPDAK